MNDPNAEDYQQNNQPDNSETAAATDDNEPRTGGTAGLAELEQMIANAAIGKRKCDVGMAIISVRDSFENNHRFQLNVICFQLKYSRDVVWLLNGTALDTFRSVDLSSLSPK